MSHKTESGLSDRSLIARHAGTVLVGQLAVMAFGVTDTIVAGRHAQESLAALAIGSALYISVYVPLLGMLSALLPIWAELRGARKPQAIGGSLRQSLYLCALACVPGMAVLLHPDPVLAWTQVPEALRPSVEQYLAVLALALPPALLFRVFSTLNQALGHPQWVTWLQVVSLLVKIPLSIWWTFGGAGMPAMGVVGCGWATLVVNCGMLAVALWLLRTQAMYAPLQVWQRMEPPNRAQLAAFARLGIPSALAVTVEVTSFTLMALFIARQGTLASAAHQIAANMAAVLYMVPLSLAIATSARVSYWRGAGQAAHARQAVYIGFRLLALICIALAAIVFIANHWIASVYSNDAQVVMAAAGLLGWVALYHLADAVQTLCIFLLRCFRITLAPLVVYGVMLWGVGLGWRLPVGLPWVWARSLNGVPRPLLGRQRRRFGGHRSGLRSHAAPGVAQLERKRAGGRCTLKVEPLPRVLRMSRLAPWRCSTCLTMARPRPVPPVSRERLRSTR